MSSVRLALVTSVTCIPPSAPPVRFQIAHVSIVPNTASPRSAAVLTPSTFSRIHCSFVAGEVGGGRQARPLADQLALRLEGADDAIGARVLPDNGVVPRATVFRIPYDGGLALIGHADGCEILSVKASPLSVRR